MKSLKIAFVFIAPALVAAAAGCALYAVSGNYDGLFTHDVLEAHTHRALVPAIVALCAFLVFIPGLFFTANILFPVVNPVSAPDQSSAADMLQAPAPALHVGQVINGTGAKFRVKALKNNTFTGADLSQYEYVLNFSL